jgi:hypothetical protein
MSAKFASRLATAAFAGLVALATLLVFPSQAFAAGSFKLKSGAVNEVGGAWHVFVTVELPRAPTLAHVPMKFLFTKEAVFERALIDGHDGPVTNRMVLQNQTPQVESLDVDFSNGSGKIFKVTRFDFSLSRERGYEAGEYSVKVRTSDGVEIGGTGRLTMNGENPVVDRRAITFNAKDKSVKKIPGYGEDGGVAENGPPKNDTDETPVQSSEVQATGTAAPFIPPDAYNKQPEEEVKTRPAGCGCVVAGASGSDGLLGLGGFAFGLALVGLRRRVRAAR